MHKEDLKARLYSEKFEDPYILIEELAMGDNEITDEELSLFLEHEDHLIVSDFLEKFNAFTPKQIEVIETYILKNLNETDGLFVSDLIEFSNKWQISSIYDKCIELINENTDEHIVLSSVFFLYERLNIDYIEDVFNVLNKVIESVEYYQNAQVAASFFLFRMSHDTKYLEDLKDYVKNGQEMNIEVITNILALHYNQPEYFAYYDQMQKLIEEH